MPIKTSRRPETIEIILKYFFIFTKRLKTSHTKMLVRINGIASPSE